jgi:hypothetical protein
MNNPSKIPGLKIWLDAADTSTVNNGTVQNSQNVFKIVDKSSGYVFRNGYGATGPSYSFGAVNGKNAITFNYYTASDINSLQAKGLWAGGVTPMASGTYSLYCVSFPYDNRQRNTNGAGTQTFQSLWLLSLANSLPTSLPVSPSPSYQPHRTLYFRSIGASTPNHPSLFQEDTSGQVGVPGATGPAITTLFDKVNSLAPGFQSFSQNDSRYVYGKTNVIGVRASDNLKKLTVIRTNYISNENYQTSNISRFSITPQQGFTPITNGPWLTIGAILPNSSNAITEGVPGPMGATELPLNLTSNFNVYAFEGHFCEFLFWDRVLSNSESNSVESYLKDKWIG